MIAVQTLAARHGTEAGIVSAWQRNSSHRRNWVRSQLERSLPAEKNSPVVAVWGLAYKADTHSTKNSPSLDLLRSLPGYRIQAHDPVAQIELAELSHVTVLDSPLGAVDGADALLVMTPWSSYASISPKELESSLRGRLIIDPYGVLDEAACRALGFDYHRLGA